MLINFKHLQEVEESYIAHLRYNLWVAGMVIILAVVSFIHAFLPFMFARVPNNIRKYMQRKSMNRDKHIVTTLRKKGIKDV
jgi:uncharacterized protein HemY